MTKIDLKRVKQIQKLNPDAAARERRKKMLDKALAKGHIDIKAARRILNSNEIPGLEDSGYMFYFKKYYYLTNGGLQKPSDPEVRDLLAGSHRIELHLICSDQVCPMPEPFHLENVKGHKVKDETEAAALMSKISGITITVKDL